LPPLLPPPLLLADRVVRSWYLLDIWVVRSWYPLDIWVVLSWYLLDIWVSRLLPVFQPHFATGPPAGGISTGLGV
jgi:hypothetical protein